MSLSPVDPKIKGNTDSNSNRPPTPVNLVQPKHQQHNTCARSGPKAETEALIPLMDHVAAYGESKNFFYSTHPSTQREPGPCSSEEANGTLPLDAQLRNLDGASLEAVQSLLRLSSSSDSLRRSPGDGGGSGTLLSLTAAHASNLCELARVQAERR